VTSRSFKGFGPKTVLKITDWFKSDDPFGAFALSKDIAKVTEMLANGEIVDASGKSLKPPTHTCSELAADEHQGRSLQVWWLGTYVDRNIRDIFEQNRASGNELDRSRSRTRT
jgi:hypothetical protein